MYLTLVLLLLSIFTTMMYRSGAFALRLSKAVNGACSYTTKKKTNRWAGVTRATPPVSSADRKKPLKLSESDEASPEVADGIKDRPFTLPPGQFRPKQSLGQNFLSDQNYVMKICDSFGDDSDKGTKVVEIGPGPGALTRVLYQRYPNMTAIEIDQRAVAFLGEKLPGLRVIHLDVLQADWPQLAVERGGPLNIIANLPYYIVSQVLFSLADSHKAIKKAVVTMQLEVAERIVAKPSTKAYGIPSVVFQLYGAPKINFKIPPTVFYPKPNVDSALLTLDFTDPHPMLTRVNGDQLRKVLSAAFRQRRKMMRQSLKDLLEQDGLKLSDRWGTLRPEQLRPEEFIELTIDLYGEESKPVVANLEAAVGREAYVSDAIWRTALFGPGSLSS